MITPTQTPADLDIDLVPEDFWAEWLIRPPADATRLRELSILTVNPAHS